MQSQCSRTNCIYGIEITVPGMVSLRVAEENVGVLVQLFYESTKLADIYSCC
jgi:hypothetical protein